MLIPQDILDIMVCPVCYQPVRYASGGSALRCDCCKRLYPFRDDIPVMLPEEAVVAPE
jgi:uncharacterized protein